MYSNFLYSSDFPLSYLSLDMKNQIDPNKFRMPIEILKLVKFGVIKSSKIRLNASFHELIARGNCVHINSMKPICARFNVVISLNISLSKPSQINNYLIKLNSST